MKLSTFFLSTALSALYLSQPIHGQEIGNNEGVEIAYQYVDSYLIHPNPETMLNCLDEHMLGRLSRVLPGKGLNQSLEEALTDIPPADGSLLSKETFGSFLTEHHFASCLQRRILSLNVMGRGEFPHVQVLSQQLHDCNGKKIWVEVSDTITLHVKRSEDGELRLDFVEHRWSPRLLPDDL